MLYPDKDGLVRCNANKVPDHVKISPGVFKPDYEPCKFRILESFICNLGATKYRYVCKLKSMVTFPKVCGECDDYEE